MQHATIVILCAISVLTNELSIASHLVFGITSTLKQHLYALPSLLVQCSNEVIICVVNPQFDWIFR